jgi:Holliday junction resolvase-like predicted endonuclease
VKKKPHRASPRPSNTRAIGTRAERRVLWHYRLRGYRVLATNVWVGGYELDLVLRRSRTIVFCEVKAKGGAERGDPLEMVTPETWRAANPQARDCELRFDVAAERKGRLDVVIDAF